ncbi:tRNA uridine-5-carboxymethylaminomethyl(34) synthesis enzyme MnmG [Lactobacillus xylocopicola]|uniref:tRNA uridine 5-carboxymethylaminomethyl modification enzyme MnmG n=1 Tax=Lactobacillus xylocopicola TaxID=2976676 RepID=A0ABM8BIV6_9LACO|nr:tRNA uridine-5-carboxymethylaminomethyl(34) synthesis enzyme MnmG [Lactobacillus xylocopicola]BDR61246.1 tRNA uridine 5-carboxymethylaminomethyl modification enzyme MnmG [Lactobacillus xylocopicola]
MIKSYDSNDYDVIVVGAGHAGTEAALASARMGQKTLLLTISLDMVAFMPCNPSVGGPAKGTVVREVDALGGEMGKAIDATYIQMRMLNTGKGPAVQALRAQADKWQYHEYLKNVIEQTPHLTLRQATVDELIVEDGVCQGLITNTGARYYAKSVVLTTGTSARGRIFIGELNYSSGPNNTIPAIKLSENLEKLGFKLRRFKTGTPPRVNSSTIDYTKTEEEPGDATPRHFSYESKDEDYRTNQVSCWMTYTNQDTHKIINANLERSPMFTGEITGVGPRYCPSIETKVVRFADKPRHQIFLEPEGRNTNEVYVGDFSTSMPEEVQLQMLHTVAGLKDAEMMRPGYAIEYDVVDPWQLKHTLETKNIKNLFTAGQMNGTSGYEEAAGQGLIAGINAALRAAKQPGFTLGRDQAYIGVLIDDLVTKGTEEPYRLLTSRAEYRLILRNDNADLRLTDAGFRLGLISEERYSKFLAKKQQLIQAHQAVKTITVHPDDQVQEFLKQIGEDELKTAVKADAFLRRPRVTVDDIERLTGKRISLERYIKEQVEINVKYAGYIKKEEQQIDRLHRQEAKQIPNDIDYAAIEGLATEAREKFAKIRPETIAQAERISGVNPADIAILSVYVQNGRYVKIQK